MRHFLHAYVPHLAQITVAKNKRVLSCVRGGLQSQCGSCVADRGANFLSQADRQLRLLEQRPGLSNVIVVGGGYCGIELATTVAERMGGRGRLQLVTGGAADLGNKFWTL